jgi:hypothetical protein
MESTIYNTVNKTYNRRTSDMIALCWRNQLTAETFTDAVLRNLAVRTLLEDGELTLTGAEMIRANSVRHLWLHNQVDRKEAIVLVWKKLDEQNKGGTRKKPAAAAAASAAPPAAPSV